MPQADSGYVEELLSPFMGNPTQFEAEAYGSLFSDDVREDDNQKVSADFFRAGDQKPSFAQPSAHHGGHSEKGTP